MSKNSSKGITLIALVITIIVLLILAGISIATLTGENGVLTKANTAKNSSIVGQEKEQIGLAYNAVMADKLGNADTTAVTSEELETELVKQEPEVTVEGSGSIKVTFNETNNSYMVDSKGNVKEYKLIHFTLDGVDLSCADGETWLSFAKQSGLNFGTYTGCESSAIYSDDIIDVGVYLVWYDETSFAGNASPYNGYIILLGDTKVKVTDQIVEGGSYKRSELSEARPNAAETEDRAWLNWKY